MVILRRSQPARFVLHDIMARGSRACAGLRGRLRAGRYISAFLVNRSERRVVRVALRNGVHIYVDPTIDLQETIFWTGEYDSLTIDRMRQLLVPEAVMLDVGANIGAYAVQLGDALRRGGRIIAIEPVPANIKRLHENVILNGLERTVEIVKTAVGDHHGMVHLRGADGIEGIASNAVVADSGVAAQITTIDAIAEAHGLVRCDLIKLDVEGCEFAALRGAEGLLRRCRPVLYLELNAHWMKHFGWTFRDLVNYLQPLEYEFANERGERLGTEAGREGVESVWAYPRDSAGDTFNNSRNPFGQ
jgi:FkbM family methyltransferase